MLGLLARLLNLVLFLVTWLVASAALAWVSTTLLMDTHEFPGGQAPPEFLVVIEQAAVAGEPPGYRYQRLRDLGERPLAAGESLRLSTPSHEFPGSCCYDFVVLEDDVDGQVIEFTANDMSDLRSRYRVHEGRVTPLFFRYDYSFYYLGYFILGGFIAGFGTARLRRRIRALAESKLPVTSPPPGPP